jgi:hypothetical protein
LSRDRNSAALTMARNVIGLFNIDFFAPLKLFDQ